MNFKSIVINKQLLNKNCLVLLTIKLNFNNNEKKTAGIKNYEELVKKAHPNAYLEYINNQPGYYRIVFDQKNPDDYLSQVYYTEGKDEAWKRAWEIIKNIGGNLIKQ